MDNEKHEVPGTACEQAVQSDLQTVTEECLVSECVGFIVPLDT